MGLIPADLPNLEAYEPRILSLLPKIQQTDFSKQLEAAEVEILADLANRQHPIYPRHFRTLEQLTPCKCFKALELIYNAATTAGAQDDRNSKQAERYAGKYLYAMRNMFINTTDGAHVPMRRKVVRG